MSALNLKNNSPLGQRFAMAMSSKHVVNQQFVRGEVPVPRHSKGPVWLTVSALCCALLGWFGLYPTPALAAPGETPGSLEILGKDGKISSICPLKHTEVRGAISGFIARVTVTQVFQNPASQKIEAVYVFPLPDDAAVDDMTIQVGDRTVRGVIKKREEARAIYEKAKVTGHVAALLDQERPNIFTQSVANIMPGEQVTVTISYLQTLKYEAGSYEFVFPMVVGPRYMPGNPTGKQAGGWSPDTTQVPDASRISPPPPPKGMRAGHDISLELAIDAGVPIQALKSTLHEIDVIRTGSSTATVKLRNEAEIPNKDFILKYKVAGEKVTDAILSQAAPANSKIGPGGYFTLILQPPARVPVEDVTPKELVFVLDTSGSMYGFPLEKAKELINKALDELYPGDTFNLITFAGDTRILFPEPVYPTAENISLAKKFLKGQAGGGGTEMMKAIRAALDPSDSQDHLRVVCFATDGYVGNDMEIIGEIQKHPNARVFSFGIGTAVNRFLLENMAKAGRGESEFVTLADKADGAAKRLYERLRTPLLTDLSINWNGLPVADVYPQRLPDLFSGKPLVLTGRYTTAWKGTIQLRGKRAGEDFVRDIPVTLAANSGKDSVLPSFWARRKIDDLMSRDWSGIQNQAPKAEVEKEITQLGLDYRLMTQFTSFVAVEERVVTENGQPKRVEVPVEMPEGVNYDKIFGSEQQSMLTAPASPMMFSAGLSNAIPIVNMKRSRGAGVGAGASGGAVGGVSGGIAGGAVKSLPLATGNPYALSQDADNKNDEATNEPPRSTERKLLESKLHPQLLKALDCWKQTGKDCESIHAGQIEIEIILTASSETISGQLKALGFQVTENRLRAKKLVGHLPVEKLAELAHMPEVRFIALAPSR